MTTLLERAFHEAAKLPELDQNVLAKWLLEELNGDQRWDAPRPNQQEG